MKENIFADWNRYLEDRAVILDSPFIPDLPIEQTHPSPLDESLKEITILMDSIKINPHNIIDMETRPDGTEVLKYKLGNKNELKPDSISPKDRALKVTYEYFNPEYGRRIKVEEDTETILDVTIIDSDECIKPLDNFFGSKHVLLRLGILVSRLVLEDLSRRPSSP